MSSITALIRYNVFLVNHCLLYDIVPKANIFPLQDGDYNKVISSQYNESLNMLAVARQIPKNEWRKSPSLCNKCNFKQQLKIQHLASFVPMSEKNYDNEIEHFQ